MHNGKTHQAYVWCAAHLTRTWHGKHTKNCHDHTQFGIVYAFQDKKTRMIRKRMPSHNSTCT